MMGGELMFNKTLASREMMLAILVLTIIGVVEEVCLLGVFLSNLGTGELSIGSIPFSWNTKFQYGPLAVLDWLKLPSSIGFGLLLTFYHVLGGFCAFLLARAYLASRRPDDAPRSPIIPILAGILYMMFPWNTFGDNFPTLVLVRALAPLVLLLLLLSLRTKVLRYSVLGGLIVGLITMGDPRSIIFLLPISFLLITLPELSVGSVGWWGAVKVNIVFAVTSAIASIAEIVYRLSGVVAGGSGTSSSSPAASLNLDAFVSNFTHASPIQFLSGISFEGTYQDFTGLLAGIPGLTAAAVTLSLAFILTLFFYCIFIIPRGDDRRRTIIILASVAMTTVFFTVWIPGDNLPFIYNILLSSDTVRESSVLSTLMIMFRTMRFPNLLLMLALVPLFTIMLQDLLPRWNWLKDAVKGGALMPRSLRMFTDHKWQKVAALAVTFVLVFSGLGVWLLPQVVRGEGMAFNGGITYEVTEESIDLSEVIAQINENPTVDRILAIQPINNNLPNLYMYQDIEGGVSQYMVHYAVDTLYSPVIQDGDYDYLATILTVMGVGYVVVNGHMIDSYYGGEYGERLVETPSFSTIVSGLENSTKFVRVAEQGKVVAFKVEYGISSTDGVYVLGGLEDYRKAYSYLSKATGSTTLPVMLDSFFDIDNISELPDWPVLVGAHRTVDDLTASLAILSSIGEALAPSEWISKQWAPHENWSPGYIQDKIGGGLSPLFLDITNYEWSFSYTPDMGYAYIEGAYDTISTQIDLEEQEYVILARVLHSPEGGELQINIDNSTYYLETQWDNESSEFLWTSLGTQNLDDSTNIDLRSLSGINAVNSILVVPLDEWKGLQEISTTFLDDRTVIQVLDPEELELNSTTGTSGTSLSVLKGGNYTTVIRNNMTVSIGQEALTQGQIVYLEQGAYRTEFSDYLTTTYREEFLSISQIGPRGQGRWSPTNQHFEWSIDNATWTSGGSSLNLTTAISNVNLWSSIRGPIIPVTSGQECVVSLDMRWFNAHQSHAVINGIREDGSSYRLKMIMAGQDGTSNWTSFSTTFLVPEGTVGIQIVLNAGGVYNSMNSTTTTWFDNVTIEQAASVSSPLILVQGDLGKSSLQIDGANISVVDGYSNTYTFDLTEEGTGVTYVPEAYYGSSIEVASSGPDVTTIPVYCTYLGLVISSENGSTGAIVVNNPFKVLVGHLSEIALVSIFTSMSLIALTLIVGPWRPKSGKKAYVRGKG
jgi:hypothetical protein